MQHNNVLSIAKKEISVFFASPIAFLFLGCYLAVTLFVFFWVETFFARNIADVRPLFEWMPILLAFLSAALTMKMWSEERRMGTIEFLLTKPINSLSLVLGKFSSCMMLVFVALLLTLFVPMSVSFLGNLDWGPVLGAYLATICLAAAYIAIGLTISAKTDNQIVSLIGTIAICLMFYLIGSDTFVSFFGGHIGEFFKLLGSGSRFASITRGVIDLRDIYYYLSLVGIFIALNVYALESIRWTKHKTSPYKKAWQATIGLFILNLLLGNFWLQDIHSARIDITSGKIYSISPATKQVLAQLEEPLLIRGYFSDKMHPLLSPLVPQLKDLIREYEIAGKGKVSVEFIDPLKDPDAEKEAGQKYGIKPVPFQIADKYQASLVNAFFNVVVQNGDQYAVLGFKDLIELQSTHETNLDVKLKNPEYDITKNIKKVSSMFQGGGALLTMIQKPITVKGFVSSDAKLPGLLVTLKQEISEYIFGLSEQAPDKLQVSLQEPEQSQGKLAEEILETYGFQPMQTSVLDDNRFYFYWVIEQGTQTVQIPLPESLSIDDFKRSFEAGVKRFSPGFMKTVAFYTAKEPSDDPYAQYMAQQNQAFSLLKEKLGEGFIIEETNLSAGNVPEEADVLVMPNPKTLSEVQLYAVDQFLMKGGTIVLSTSPYHVEYTGRAFELEPQSSGLTTWLAHHGIQQEQSMIYDPQNSRLPVPVERRIGGFVVQDIQMLEYPLFINARDKQLNQGHLITSSLPEVTVNWASPIILSDLSNELKATTLITSSQKSWVSNDIKVMPDFDTYPKYGFSESETHGSHTIGAVVEGEFHSYFADKPSPLFSQNSDNEEKDKNKNKKQIIDGVITKSPESAKIILFSSNEFLSDVSLRLASTINSDLSLNAIQLLQNSIDWALEDRSLLSIRSRGYFSKTLLPISSQARMLWEYLNYVIAIIGLLSIYMVNRYYRKVKLNRYQMILHSGV